MENRIHPTHLPARIEMLEGQALFMRMVLMALISAHPRPALVADHMVVMWSDLQEQLQPNPEHTPEQRVAQANKLTAAKSAWNVLNDALRRPPRSST